MKNDARYPAIGVIHHRDALHPTPPSGGVGRADRGRNAS